MSSRNKIVILVIGAMLVSLLFVDKLESSVTIIGISMLLGFWAKL